MVALARNRKISPALLESDPFLVSLRQVRKSLISNQVEDPMTLGQDDEIMRLSMILVQNASTTDHIDQRSESPSDNLSYDHAPKNHASSHPSENELENLGLEEIGQYSLAIAMPQSNCHTLPSQGEAESDFTSSSSISSELEIESLDLAVIEKIPEIANRLLELYIAREKSHPGRDGLEGGDIRFCQGGSEANSRSGPGNSRVQSPYCPSGGIRTTSLNVQGKRPRQDGDESDNEERRVRRRSATSKLHDTEDSNLWACPFHKRNRQLYTSCGKIILKDVSRVKQHLRRSHQQPIHCDRCSLTFISNTERTEHTRMESPCSLRNQIRWEGITEDQKSELSKKMSPKYTARENWYKIYGIIFPGEAVPESPYLDLVNSEELREILAFADLERPSIVNEVLAGMPEYESLHTDERCEFANVVTERFLISLVERFESSRAAYQISAGYDHQPEASRRFSDVPLSHSELPSSHAALRDTANPSATTLPVSTSWDSLLDWPQSSQAGEGLDPLEPDAASPLGDLNDSVGLQGLDGYDVWNFLDGSP
jgi:hypothetical protein